MLVGGFAKKFANELEKRNGLTPPQKYGKTYVRTHDALTFKELAEDMIKSTGASILYHTKICGVVIEDETFKG